MKFHSKLVHIFAQICLLIQLVYENTCKYNQLKYSSCTFVKYASFNAALSNLSDTL
jgi:hypothetical protein